MKRGIEMSWAYDYKGRLALRIEKKRGKLTLAEIQDLIMYEERQRYCGHYAIILNCSEAAMGGDDLYLEDGQKGDTVALYQIEEGRNGRPGKKGDQHGTDSKGSEGGFSGGV